MNSRQRPSTPPATDTQRSTEPAFLRPLVAVLFIVLLAGQFSFERIGRSNPVYVPERLFALIVLTFSVAVVVLANSRSTRAVGHGTLLIVTPTVYALVTALWGPHTPNYWSTVTDLGCILLACGALATLLRWRPTITAVTVLWCMLGAGIIFAIAGLASSSAGARTAAFGGGPNIFSRVTILGFIALVGLIVIRKLPVWTIAISPVMIVATVASGSRGGMLAGLAGVAVLLPLLGHLRRSQLLAALGILLIFALVVYRRYADVVDQTISGRVVDLTLQQGYSSGRGRLVAAAWDMFEARPIAGWGLTGFADQYGQGFTYPHNMVLQALAEGGSIALLFLAITFAVFLKAARRPNILGRVFTASATVIFVSSMFSGDYYDTRFLWIFMLLVIFTRPEAFVLREVPNASGSKDRAPM